MFKNPYFTMINISESRYLLPFGQSISDHKHGIKISRTGEDIWNLLDKYACEDDLISGFIAESDIPDSSVSEVSSDIKAFLDQLKNLGILLDELPSHRELSTDTRGVSFDEAYNNADIDAVTKVTIAGINLELSTGPALKDAKFSAFESDFTNTTDLQIRTTEKDITVSEKETIIADASEMTISESESFYIIRYKKNTCVKEMHIRKAGPEVLICLVSGYGAASASDEVFHAIRIPFLLTAEKKGMYAIHSASVLYKENAWLFSAPAGTGKSTHARLWTQYSDAVNINGDLNLIGIKEGYPYVFGIPWCGTSEIFTKEDYPLGGVVFLKQASENRIEEFTYEKALVTLSRRTISPLWNSESLKKMMLDLEPVSSKVPSLRLYCTKDPEAQKVLQEYITY